VIGPCVFVNIVYWKSCAVAKIWLCVRSLCGNGLGRDRYVATASAGAIAWYSFQWMQEGPSLFWLVAVPVQAVQLLAPLHFLAKSRSLQIGSEEWRHAHACWHWAAVTCATSASLLSHFCWSSAALTRLR
jgi:hypothetical protein